MNILYINHYAGSPKYGMEYRPYYMAKKWHEKGHKVRILAASYSHVRSVQPKITNKTSEMIDGIEYTWYPTPKYEQNGFARVKNILTFLKEVWSDSVSAYPGTDNPAKTSAADNPVFHKTDAPGNWPYPPAHVDSLYALPRPRQI